MRKITLFTATFICSLMASAQGWERPVIDAGTDFVVEDTMYLYNVDAQMFFTQGNSWGTQASLASTGLMVKVHEYVADGAEWDGQTYTITDLVSGKWKYLFIDSDGGYGGEAYVDRASQENYFWFITKQSNGYYHLSGADLNPLYNLTKYPANYFGAALIGGELSTVAYPLLDINNRPEEDTYYLDWTFVTQETYAAYYNKVVIYEKAMTLKEKIDEGNDRGLDMSPCEAVYNNTSSTLEELDAAYQQAMEILAEADEKDVTPDNPKDMTEYIQNPNFDNGVTGWTKEGKAQTFEANGWVPSTVDGVMSAPALNLWGNNAAINVSQTITDLPNGIYKFWAGGYSQANGPWFFANDAKADITSGGPTQYSVLTCVSDKTMTLGVAFPAEGVQWVMADCFRLEYFGNGYEAYNMWINETLATGGSYDGVTCMQQLHDDYDAALEALMAATTSEEITPLLAQFLVLQDSIKANAAAYADYVAAVASATEIVESGKYGGDDFDILSDYMMDNEPDETFPNGASGYILANLTLTTEEITAETDFLNTLIKNAVENGMAEGASATALINNPDFSNGLTGWTYNKSLGTPATGGMAENPNVERWNENFDFYQDVTLPNGVYRLDVQAFYRTADNSTAEAAFNTGESEVLTSIYANAGEQDVINIYSQPQESGFYKEDNAYTMTNGAGEVPNSMKTASEAFTAGLYENSVYGVVYNKTLRIGIHSLNASQTDRWSIWDNFRLTYMGYDAELISQALDIALVKAEELKTNPMSAEAMSTLDAAIEDAKSQTEPREQLQAIAELYAAQAVAQVSVDWYAKLIAYGEEMMDALATYGETASKEAIDNALNLYDEIEAVMTSGLWNDEQCEEKCKEAVTAIASLKVPADPATDDDPVDFTNIIVNSTFDTIGDFTGWSGTKFGAGGTTSTCAEHYNKTYDTYQDLIGLPAGTYQLNVQAYYRRGSADNDYAIHTANPDSALNAFLYAKTADGEFSSPIMGIGTAATETSCYEGGTTPWGELVVPNTMESGNAYFEAGHYTGNSVTFTVGTDGTLRIGVRKNVSISTDWSLFDNFTLFYYGSKSSKTPSGNPVGIESLTSNRLPLNANRYNLSGQRVGNDYKGIIIANGKKYLVK